MPAEFDGKVGVARAALLLCALAVTSCASDDRVVRTTEAKVMAATTACHVPRDAVILNKDRSYQFSRDYNANQWNCLEWNLLDCEGGQKVFEPMSCVMHQE
jgi:hypothetical protein